MNREIKFRAWDESTKEMWYPKDYPLTYHSEKFNSAELLQRYDNVMQYTGLKENAFEDVWKNKEIYEGDIIEFIDGERLVVEWNDDTCQWQYSDGSPINSEERYATHKMILGNIYENPELLNHKTQEVV